MVVTYTNDQPASDKYYVAGTWTNWENGKIQMAKKSDGTYTLANQALSAAAQFKIIKEAADGGTATWYGGAADGETYWVTADNHTDISLTGGDGGKNFYMPIEGKWTFTVDPTGDTPTLTVDGWPEWEYYLMGDFNEWATSNSYKFSEAGGVYSLSKPIKLGEKFKIYAKRGSEEKWYGAVSNGDFYVNAEYVDTELSLTTPGENFLMNLSNKKPSWTIDFSPANNTLKLSNFISDIAKLPFEYDGGRSGIETTPGLTQTELGTDYSSSPKLKFDTTSDAVILHFDERPGTLTYEIKGNSFSGGTFQVLTSVNGEDWVVLKEYSSIDKGQSEEFPNLGENVRYIKWLYTEKSTGNVALGNIKLEKYSFTPTITVTPAQTTVAAEGGSGILTITSNFDMEFDGDPIVYFDEDGQQITRPSWVTSLAVNNPVTQAIYNIQPNTGDARTVYFKVMFATSEGETVYSDMITITQKANVPTTTYAKVTSTADITDGNYLIVYEGASVAFDGSLETLDAVSNTIDVEIENDTIVTDKDAYFTIDVTNGTIKSCSGLYIGVSSNSNGLKQTDNATTYTHTFSIDDSKNAVIAAAFTESTMTLRFNKATDQARFRYFKSGQQDIQLYKEVIEEPVEDVPFTLIISDKATDGESYFATIGNIGTGNFVVPTDVSVSTVVVNEKGKIERDKFFGPAVIPGAGAYLVEADAPGEYEFRPATAEDDEVETIGDNMLHPFMKGETAAAPEGGLDDEYTFYKLSLKQGGVKNSVGFYYGAAVGAPFESANDHSAYLAVPKSVYNPNPANEGILIQFDGDADGIQGVSTTEQGAKEVYTLTGTRVQGSLPKGVYIVNGRKQVVR